MKKILFILLIIFSYSVNILSQIIKKNQPNKKFTLVSPAFKNGEEIPKEYTCDGVAPKEKQISPPLAWQNPPKGTKYYVLFFEDLDAIQNPPTIAYLKNPPMVHWIVMNIPGIEKGLPADVSIPKIPEATELKNSFLDIPANLYKFYRNTYFGPCPAKGTTHRYAFRLLALNVKIEINAMLDYIADLDKTANPNVNRSQIVLPAQRFIIDMEPDPTDPTKERSVYNHILGEAVLTGKYTRK